MSLKRKLSLYVAVITSIVLVPAIAFAAEAGGYNDSYTKAFVGIGAGLAIGLGALGGTMGQGRATAAALEGIARQPSAAPRIQTAMILGLAMIESLVLFALLIAYLMQGKIA